VSARQGRVHSRGITTFWNDKVIISIFPLNEVRRAKLHAELDATYTHLCGLTRDELCYTPFSVDPKEVHGEDFPGETFRVLKDRPSNGQRNT